MGSWTVKQETCWQKMAVRIAKRAEGAAVVEIFTKCDAGPRRTAKKNTQILFIQKAAGRDPVFRTPEEKRWISETVKRAMQAKGIKGLAEIAEAIGRYLVQSYRAHVAAGRSKKGAMAALAPSTRRRKQKAGTLGKGVMRDSGEVVDSLTFGVKVHRG